MNLQEILKRRKELKADYMARSATMTAEELDNINKELDELDKAEQEINKRNALTQRMNGMNVEVVEREAQTVRTEATVNDEKALRGKRYKERGGVEIQVRAAVTVDGTGKTGVLLPTHTAPTIEPFPWNEVSSIIDAVNMISLPNGTSYTQVYQVSTGEADYTIEPTKTGDASSDKDGVYNLVTTTFNSATIKRNKITALTYLTEELQVIPELDYASLVESNVSLALKKKIAKEVILGNGVGEHFVGLAAATSTSGLNADTYNDVETKIDENFLFDTVVSYGGEEDIEGRQALLMNKLTLKEIARVRDTNKRTVYTISFSGNTAVVDGVRVIFTKHLKPYQNATANEIWGIYGDFSKYVMLNFGGESVETSREFKFDQGITAVRGRVYAGGNLAGYKAFTRLTKPSIA